MNKCVRMAAACLAMTLVLGGCGNQIPDMSDEEVQMVGEYAAITLLKYDAAHRSRLVDASEIAAYDEKEKRLQELMAQSTPAEQPEKEKTEAEVLEADTGQNGETGLAVGLEEFYHLPAGMTISYQGEAVCDSYSGEASTDAFSLDAAQGKKLLVLKFAILNQSGSDQEIDLFSKSAIYRVTVNGTYSRGTLTTMLTDDMSTFEGSIPSGESRKVVLIVEIEKDMAESITSVALGFKNESRSGTIQLK